MKNKRSALQNAAHVPGEQRTARFVLEKYHGAKRGLMGIDSGSMAPAGAILWSDRAKQLDRNA